jgi:bla regulator protein BlaR1
VIADIFAYAVLISLLLGLAAASVERSLAEFGLPRRFAWLGAYAVAVAFPATALWLAAGTVPPAADSFLVEYAREITPYANVDWDTTLGLAWAASTHVMLGAWLRLTLVAKRWPRLESDAGPVAVSDDVGPAVFGILDPRIVLPRWLIQAPASARHLVMAHEREHIAARDPAVIVASQLIAILLPWNLPLWWFARRLRAAIEIDCDARVLRTGVDPVHYGDVLLAVGQHGSSSPHMAAALIEPVTQLERRIRIMLAKPRPGSGRRVVVALAVALGIAACATQVEPPVLSSTFVLSVDRQGSLSVHGTSVALNDRTVVEQAFAALSRDADTALIVEGEEGAPVEGMRRAAELLQTAGAQKISFRTRAANQP